MIGIAWTLLATRVLADDSQSGTPLTVQENYETLINDGMRAFAARRYEVARKAFSRAHALQPSARTLRGLGITDFALENYGLARAELEGALAAQTVRLTPEQRNEVEDLLDWMRNNLGTVRLEYTPAQSRAQIDERAVVIGDVLLEPGEHRLRVSAQGFHAHEQSFRLLISSEPLHLRVSLTAIPPTQNVDQPSSAWLWLGATSVTATIAGSVLFAVGRSYVDRVEDATAAPERDPAATKSRGFWLTLMGGTLVGLGVSGVVGAIVMRVSQPAEHEKLSWQLQVTPSSLGIQRTF